MLRTGIKSFLLSIHLSDIHLVLYFLLPVLFLPQTQLEVKYNVFVLMVQSVLFRCIRVQIPALFLATR